MSFNDGLAEHDSFKPQQYAVPLDGRPRQCACAQCHKNNVFAGLPTACVSCHLTNFNGTTNPNHGAAGFSQNCAVCHASSTWQGATFSHNNTPFPLTGAHINVAPCAQCHKNNLFAGLPTACISCHLTDFNGTTNPNHVSADSAGMQTVSFNDELARLSV